MRKLLLTAFALICGLNIATAQATNYPNGSTVANFTVTDTEGNTVDLYTITASGKYVLLDFFFDTCPPCQATQPTFNEFYDKYGCNTGDVFCVSINNGTDNDAAVIAYEAAYGGSFHHSPAVSSDGGSTAVKDAFGVSAYPTYCIVGPDNKMVMNDIWPITNVATFEAAFPVTLTPMACSFASIAEEPVTNLTVFPNPANQNGTIAFHSAINTTATIDIYNLLGEKMSSTTTSIISGTNSVNFDFSQLATGQYVARLNLESSVMTVKFSIVH
jgi:thiol-disulfide isomerase/thioredoxin